MPIDEVIDLAKEILREKGIPGSDALCEGLRGHGVLPDSVGKRRSFDVDDDLATALVLADGIELVELRKKVSPGVRDLTKHKQHLVDAWATCEILRRLGFRNDEMAVSWGPVPGQGDEVLFAVVTSRGIRMVIGISIVPAASQEEALSGWKELWEDVVAAGEDDLSVLLSRSAMGETVRVVALASELARQGLGIPNYPALERPLTILAGPAVSLAQGGKA